MLVAEARSERVLGFCSLPIDHTSVRRVLLLSPNWLGDAIMALPAMAAVRRALPQATIDVAARPSVAPLFALVPDAGSVVTLASRTAAAGIRNGQYDAAILFPNSFNAAWVAKQAGVSQRWGYA